MGHQPMAVNAPISLAMQRSRWAGLGAAYFFYFGILATLQPYLATLYLEHGVSAGRVGPSVALLYVLAGFVPLVATAAAAHLGIHSRRAFGLCAGAAVALAAALAFLGAGVSQLSYVVLIACLTAAYAPLNALLDTSALQACQQFQWSFGKLRLMGSIGYITTVTVMGRLLPMHEVSRPVHLATTILIACVLATTAWLPDVQVTHETAATAAASPRAAQPSARALLCLLAACGLHYASFGPFMFGFTLYGQSVGLNPTQIGLGWSLGVAGELAMFSVTGALLQRYGWRRLLWFAFLFAPLRWLALAVFPLPVTFFVTQPLHGPSFALFYVAAMAALSEVTPLSRALRSQTVFCALAAGLASGPAMLLAGYAYAYMSVASMFACMLPANLLALTLLGLSIRYAPPAAAIRAKDEGAF